MTPERLEQIKEYYAHERTIGECVEEIERLKSQLRATELDVHEAKVEVCKLEDQLASARAELEKANTLLAIVAKPAKEINAEMESLHRELTRMRQALQQAALYVCSGACEESTVIPEGEHSALCQEVGAALGTVVSP